METTSVNWSHTNATLAPPGRPQWWQNLNTAFRVLMPVILIIIMLAMGCTITLREILNHLKRPVPALIGACSQFIFLPLVTFGAAHALQMPPLRAIGMLIWACSPAGSVSNIYAFWVDGDVPLSVCMTSISTVLALGMMPLNLYIYSRSFTSRQTVIPYLNIFISLLSILVPVSIGMLIRWKKPKLAAKILRIGTVAGLASIGLAITMEGFLFPEVYRSGWHVYLGAVLMPLVGYAGGFCISKILCQTYKVARTVAYETGMQNISLAITLVSLSYSGGESGEILMFIVVAGTFGMIDGTVCVILYKLYHKVRGKHEAGLSEEMVTKKKSKCKDMENSTQIDEKEKKTIVTTIAGTDNPVLPNFLRKI